MPLKDWIQSLENGFEVFVRRNTRQGIIHEFSVVLIYKGVCISRYDTAHNRAHRDILGKRAGWINFVECENMTYNQAFESALRDYENNYQSYLEFYSQN